MTKPKQSQQMDSLVTILSQTCCLCVILISVTGVELLVIWQHAPKRPQVILTTCIRENLLQEIHALFSMTGKAAKAIEGPSRYSLCGVWSVFDTTEEYKAAVSAQLTLNSIFETGSPNGEGRFLFSAQSVFQCAPADCLCSRVPEHIVTAFFLKRDT